MARLEQVQCVLDSVCTFDKPRTYLHTCTGKTMTANAVANYLKKKILLVTVSVMMERDLTKVSLVITF